MCRRDFLLFKSWVHILLVSHLSFAYPKRVQEEKINRAWYCFASHAKAIKTKTVRGGRGERRASREIGNRCEVKKKEKWILNKQKKFLLFCSPSSLLPAYLLWLFRIAHSHNKILIFICFFLYIRHSCCFKEKILKVLFCAHVDFKDKYIQSKQLELRDSE